MTRLSRKLKCWIRRELRTEEGSRAKNEEFVIRTNYYKHINVQFAISPVGGHLEQGVLVLYDFFS